MCSEATAAAYVADLQAINLALSMAQAESENNKARRHIIIWSDSQAAIRSLAKPESGTGAYVMQRIFQQVDSPRHSGHIVRVRWI